jgi:histidinol-phosphate phosphatase family protein
VAKGTLTTKQLDEVNARLLQLLRRDGDGWDAIYTCPHHPQGGPSAKNRFVRTCGCRKPKPGLLLRAAREHGIRLTSSWMIGDGLNDVQAGRAAGCRTILVTRLKVEQIQRFLGLKGATPDAVVPDLAAALRVVRQGGAP